MKTYEYWSDNPRNNPGMEVMGCETKKITEKKN